MAEHTPQDIALAALTLNIGLMKILEQKGLLKNEEAKDVMNSALDATSPQQRLAVAAIFKDMGAS